MMTEEKQLGITKINKNYQDEKERDVALRAYLSFYGALPPDAGSECQNQLSEVISRIVDRRLNISLIYVLYLWGSYKRVLNDLKVNIENEIECLTLIFNLNTLQHRCHHQFTDFPIKRFTSIGKKNFLKFLSLDEEALAGLLYSEKHENLRELIVILAQMNSASRSIFHRSLFSARENKESKFPDDIILSLARYILKSERLPGSSSMTTVVLAILINAAKNIPVEEPMRQCINRFKVVMANYYRIERYYKRLRERNIVLLDQTREFLSSKLYILCTSYPATYVLNENGRIIIDDSINLKPKKLYKSFRPEFESDDDIEEPAADNLCRTEHPTRKKAATLNDQVKAKYANREHYKHRPKTYTCSRNPSSFLYSQAENGYEYNWISSAPH